MVPLPPRWLAVFLSGLAAFWIAYVTRGADHTLDAVLVAVAVASVLFYALGRGGTEGFEDAILDDIPAEDIEEAFKFLSFDAETYGTVLRSSGDRFSAGTFDAAPALGTVEGRSQGILLNATPAIEGPKADYLLNSDRGNFDSTAYLTKFTVVLVVSVNPTDLAASSPVRLLRVPGQGASADVMRVMATVVGGVTKFVVYHDAQNGADTTTTPASVTVTVDVDDWSKTPLVLAFGVDTSSSTSQSKVYVTARAIKMLSTADAAENVHSNDTDSEGTYAITPGQTGGVLPGSARMVLGFEADNNTADVRLYSFAMFRDLLTESQLKRVFNHYNDRFHLFLDGPPDAVPGACPYPAKLCEDEVCADITNWADPNEIVWKYPRCHDAIDEYCSDSDNKKDVPACFCWNEDDPKFDSIECRLWRAFIKKDENMHKDAILASLSDDDLKLIKNKYKLKGASEIAKAEETKEAEKRGEEGSCSRSAARDSEGSCPRSAARDSEDSGSGSAAKCPSGVKDHYKGGDHEAADDSGGEAPRVNDYYAKDLGSATRRRRRSGRVDDDKDSDDVGNTKDYSGVFDAYSRGGHHGVADNEVHSHAGSGHGPLGVRTEGSEHGIYDSMRWRDNKDQSRISSIETPPFDRWGADGSKKGGGWLRGLFS